ncbi:MAG TPA: putative molybdenum carrier protein [Puia sp.]|jgi:hypothetical protein
MENEIAACLCMRCGKRDDFKSDFCPNGHDDWLEYEDVKERNQFFDRAVKLSGLSPDKLELAFMDKTVNSITLKVIIEKVISGGQTGADRMGLEIAKFLGYPTGGTAPKGFRTENGPDLSLREEFGLRESYSSSYSPRTTQNVLDSHFTVLFGDMLSSGSKATIDACLKYHQPYVENPSVEELIDKIKANYVKVLNIAGNRGSKFGPYIDTSRATLMAALLYFKPEEP